MNTQKLYELFANGYINSSQKEILNDIYSKKTFSLFYEIRTLLYLGVLTLSAGIGILIYKNIDSIGHGFIIAAISLCMGACFYYVVKKRAPFSLQEVESQGPLFDYILLLGCLLFLSLEGYMQFQYSIFGTKYGLAVFIPAILFLTLAYIFDHKGVLSLGITGLGSWAGLTVTPIGFWNNFNFSDKTLINTGIIFGIFLLSLAFFFHQKNIKKHFTYTYLNFGFNILFISTLAGLFSLQQDFLYFPLLVVVSTAAIWYAKKTQSFLFLLLASIHFYLGVTYILSNLINWDSFFIMIYFFFSCAAVVRFIFSYKKFLKP